MERYRESARKRANARQERLEERRARAWEIAREAARLLKQDFGATRVTLFGSLVGPARFHPHSDVDLAVAGLPEGDYYRALSHLLSLDPGISVDLVEEVFASPRLLAKIRREGKSL